MLQRLLFQHYQGQLLTQQLPHLISLFFRLMALAGPVRATVLTFFNPAVALGLGIVVLGQSLTTGMLLGFPLVLLGAYWATRSPTEESREPSSDTT